MIYLIVSAAFKNKERTEYESILKIGYTSETGKKSRFDTYITENPTIQVLYLIPEATEQDEKNLHKHFKKYKKYRQEWFSYEQEILDFFKSHTTRESLQDLDVAITPKKSVGKKKEIYNTYLEPVLSWKIKNEPESYIITLTELYDLLDNTLISYNNDKLDFYFKTTYPEVDFDGYKHFNYNNAPENIKSILEEFYSINSFVDRFKFIEEQNTTLDSEMFESFLQYIPIIFPNYLSLLGWEKVKTHGYQESKILSNFSKISTTKEVFARIKETILNTFLIGERYTKSFIKETIKNIYESNNYGKTPKAIDLGEYFDLKNCLIPNKETGKSDNGYEILKQKD